MPDTNTGVMGSVTEFVTSDRLLGPGRGLNGGRGYYINEGKLTYGAIGADLALNQVVIPIYEDAVVPGILNATLDRAGLTSGVGREFLQSFYDRNFDRANLPVDESYIQQFKKWKPFGFLAGEESVDKTPLLDIPEQIEQQVQQNPSHARPPRTGKRKPRSASAKHRQKIRAQNADDFFVDAEAFHEPTEAEIEAEAQAVEEKKMRLRAKLIAEAAEEEAAQQRIRLRSVYGGDGRAAHPSWFAACRSYAAGHGTLAIKWLLERQSLRLPRHRRWLGWRCICTSCCNARQACGSRGAWARVGQ